MKKDSTKPNDATSFKQTKLGIIPRSKLIKLEAQGVNRGLKFIESAENQKVTPELILKIHKKSFGFIFSWAGKFRTIDVMIGGKKAPEHFKVSAMIKEYCDDLEERFKNLPDRKNVDLYFKELVSFLA